MSQPTKTAWGAVAAALIAILAAKPEFFLGILTDHAGILVPVGASVFLSFGIPHRFKHCLPSAKWIPVLSAVVCIFTYMTLRASWVMKFGGEYTTPDGVVDFFVALTLSVLIPHLYDQLPESMRKRWSYTTLKQVRTKTGDIVERPADHPSEDGEKTVRHDQSGHGYPNYLLLIGGLMSVVLGIVLVVPALFWPWVWWIAGGFVALGVTAILSEIGN